MSNEDLTYAGGLEELKARYNGRRAPFDFGQETLPALDEDLGLLKAQIVPPEATGRLPSDPKKATSWTRKRRQIAEEFIGNSQLAYLNAMLVSNLRKSDAPSQTAPLFLRLWREEHAHLIDVLDLRWKVSSIMTFADHGETSVQRQVGQAMRMMFAMMKLYEFERLFSGNGPETAFRFGDKTNAKLPMEMESFSLVNGGLDANTLAPVWELALGDDGIAPLANHLFEELNRDPASLFRRLARMKAKRLQRMGKA